MHEPPPVIMKPLRYLPAAEVTAAAPPLIERLGLAELTMRSLGRHAELPPKIGVHPRQRGSLAHAMPALLRGEAEDGSGDLIGMKWIAGFPANPTLGLATYNALVILNDAATGLPIAVMDAGAITAQRTAAVSGVAIRRFAPERRDRPARVAVLGAGAQARGHLPVIGHVLGGAAVAVADMDRARAERVAEELGGSSGLGSVRVASGIHEAVAEADVVVSVVSFGPDRQALDPAWLLPDALFVAVDYDMQAPAALAREAFFMVDERDQFLATRSSETFAGYPEPDMTIGEALRESVRRPAGRILVSHLGVGLADVVFASAILTRAEELGLGRILPR
jgi:ornithine cyclodeaminase/alanine dehydrogenase-like protein (mu-crystallin family)